MQPLPVINPITANDFRKNIIALHIQTKALDIDYHANRLLIQQQISEQVKKMKTLQDIKPIK